MLAAKALGDDDTYTAKAVRYQRLNDEYDKFTKAAGLRSQKERGNIPEFGTKEGEAAEKAAMSVSTPVSESSAPQMQNFYGNSNIDVVNQPKDVIIKVKNSELQNGLPIQGNANSIVDKTDDNGKTLQRRIYGADGKAAIDYDTTDHGLPKQHPTGAHKHIFDYTKKMPRGAPMELTEEELAQNADIIQRGVNYHDKE